MKLYAFLELCIYLSLIPISFRILLGIDLSKIFLKGRVIEIRILYVFVSIMMAKIVGDFLVVVMDFFRLLFDIVP